MRNSGHIGVLTQQQSEDAIETQLDNISPIAQDSQNIRPMLWKCQQDQKGPARQQSYTGQPQGTDLLF